MALRKFCPSAAGVITDAHTTVSTRSRKTSSSAGGNASAKVFETLLGAHVRSGAIVTVALARHEDFVALTACNHMLSAHSIGSEEHNAATTALELRLQELREWQIGKLREGGIEGGIETARIRALLLGPLKAQGTLHSTVLVRPGDTAMLVELDHARKMMDPDSDELAALEAAATVQLQKLCEWQIEKLREGGAHSAGHGGRWAGESRTVVGGGAAQAQVSSKRQRLGANRRTVSELSELSKQCAFYRLLIRTTKSDSSRAAYEKRLREVLIEIEEEVTKR
jgi:hypothetical protein